MGDRQRHEVSSEKTKRRQVFSEETKGRQFSDFSSKADVPPVNYFLSGLPLKRLLGGWVLEDLEWVREVVLLTELSDLKKPGELVVGISREDADTMLM